MHELFDRYMGVRWLAPDATHIPEMPPVAMAPIEYGYVPPFRYRWSNSYHGAPGSAGHTEFERAHHFRMPRFAVSYGHNFYQLVPPPEYFPEHPEYFGMNEDGERVAMDDPEDYKREWGQRALDRIYQLCMTNPELPGVIMKTLRRWHAANPGAEFWCIMQEDLGTHCLCPECAAVDEREGTPMGSMLTGINRTADLFAEEFPDKDIMTYAYAYTRRPPKHMQPRDNVYFQLCTIECDFLRPLEERTRDENRRFMKDLEAWSKLTGNLLVYDYAPNFASWMRPHPNLHVIVPNLRTYAEHDVIGTFVQGDPYGTGGMTPLRTYLIAKGMWNPYVDHAALREEFLRLYYAETAPYMDEYIDFMTEYALEKKVVMGCFDDGAWLDATFARRAIEIMKRALAAAETDTIRRRVREQWLRLQYVGLTCAADVTKEPGRYLLERPAEIDSLEFLEWCRELGIRQLDEQYGRFHVPLEKSVEEHLGPLGQRRPKEVYPYVSIENARYAAEVAPGLAGAIIRFEDKRAGKDVFRGVQSVASQRWTLQEWYLQAKGTTVREEPLRTDYEIIAQSPRSVTVRGTLESGLVVERTAAFQSDEGPLELRYTIKNEGPEPIVPAVKVHPEFWTHGDREPEIWLEKNGQWEKHPLKVMEAGFFGGEPIEAAGVSRWAARVPGKRLVVAMTVHPDELENLFYFFNTRNEHVNLELVPDRAPLEPGEARTVRTAISLDTRLPKD
ncbi:MAG TPA: DUF4838 domain-containing protein [Candidatus Hydrogenedentes bacterium]|nr:DUF4838 domain-containing protein [Candidatus Hydrogenedentota bacterium]